MNKFKFGVYCLGGKMSKRTNIEMVSELRMLSNSVLRDKIIKEAEDCSFHDYKSNAVCGKMFFVEVANWFYNNIHKVTDSNTASSDIEIMKKIEDDVKNGVYDEVADEIDRKNMRNDILSNTSNLREAQALIKGLNL